MRTNELKNEIYEIKNSEEKIKRKSLIYKTNKYMHDVCMYVYMYICICICIYVYVYVYIHMYVYLLVIVFIPLK